MLLHLSFKPDLTGVLLPQQPAGMELKKKGKYPEPNTPRVCFAPTVLQCFQAIYPNVCDFFEKRNYPHMDFYVYSVVPGQDIGLITNREIVEKRWVHDAHITGECWATKPVTVGLVEKVRIANTNKIESLIYHPFDDPKEPARTLAPIAAEFTVTPVPGSRRWMHVRG